MIDAMMRQIETPNTRRGYTAIELMVVLGIIAVVIAFGVPAFNQMQRELDQSRAVQSIEGALARARTAAVASGKPTALRFVRADWESADAGQTVFAGDRMVVLTYQWTETQQQNSYRFPLQIVMATRFERLQDDKPLLLPRGWWAAPVDAIDDPATSPALAYVTGRLNQFTLDAAQNPNQFCDLNDFLIVFDERGNLVQPNRTGFRLTGMDMNQEPPVESEGLWRASRLDEPFRRHNASGVLLYERENLAGGTWAGLTEQERISLLKRIGAPFLVTPSGEMVRARTEAAD